MARAAGLLAVAVLPLAAGLGTGSLTNPVVLAPTYRTAMLIAACVLIVGAATAVICIPNAMPVQSRPDPVRCTAPHPAPPLSPQPANTAEPRQAERV